MKWLKFLRQINHDSPGPELYHIPAQVIAAWIEQGKLEVHDYEDGETWVSQAEFATLALLYQEMDYLE